MRHGSETMCIGLPVATVFANDKAVNSVALYKDSEIVHPRGHLRPDATNKTSDTCRRVPHADARKIRFGRRRHQKSLEQLLSIVPSPWGFS